ncbi:hypothetical protein FRACYDRAFT_221053 [Fragilariopsis cylindrus CCMP1102]|uniref:Potassium channel tetramerisation-type BTB domain-containing protein n=1 Tax=Fragilariopsis cylindrus CCMP1102 TaxID=635003 RepID=A0A1E7EQ39_9STRA|nr:hypothetical protein FRACYDRAFT_221053 [Fragilariopsis cylindrus CCMP1102]|eukprot:OEU08100.1 hypothetical protein FRACYDRAFT_221053 [Fragilariopsis cylindrus CCMP1102]
MNDDGPDNVDGEGGGGGGAAVMDTTATATSPWESVLKDMETHATKQKETLQQLRRRADDTETADDAETSLAGSRKEIKVLKEENDKLQKGKNTMNAVGSVSNNDDDIIEINAGGKVTCALRSTLSLVAPDTTFSNMFSGRWDGSLTRDNNGHVLLDHDPELIEIIVHFLRTKKTEDLSNPMESPTIPDGKEKEFEILLHYFGLSDFFYPPSVLLPLDIANIEVVQSHGSVVDVTKSVNKIQFTNAASRERAHWFVACKPSLDVSEEGSFWKVTIDVLPDNRWIYLGIIGNIGASNFSYSDSTSYGWGCNGHVDDGGLIRSGDSGWTGFTEGECLYFHLKSNKLTMFSVDKNRKFVIGGIATTAICKYYIHFNLTNHAARTAPVFGAKISLEPLSDEERKLLPEN